MKEVDVVGDSVNVADRVAVCTMDELLLRCVWDKVGRVSDSVTDTLSCCVCVGV